MSETHSTRREKHKAKTEKNEPCAVADYRMLLDATRIKNTLFDLNSRLASLESKIDQILPQKKPRMHMRTTVECENMSFPSIAEEYGSETVIDVMYRRNTETPPVDGGVGVDNRLLFSLPRATDDMLKWWGEKEKFKARGNIGLFLGGNSRDKEFRRVDLIPVAVEHDIPFYAAHVDVGDSTDYLGRYQETFIKQMNVANTCMFVIAPDKNDYYTYAQIVYAIASGFTNIAVAYNYEMTPATYSTEEVSMNVIGSMEQHSTRERHSECMDIINRLMTHYTSAVSQIVGTIKGERLLSRISSLNDGVFSLVDSIHMNQEEMKTSKNKGGLSVREREAMFLEINGNASTDVGVLLWAIFGACLMKDIPSSSWETVFVNINKPGSVFGKVRMISDAIKSQQIDTQHEKDISCVGEILNCAINRK